MCASRQGNTSPLTTSPSLQRVDTKLVVKMKRSFEQCSVQLLDKLAKHLRARLPPGSIQRMEYVVGSPPSTRIIII